MRRNRTRSILGLGLFLAAAAAGAVVAWRLSPQRLLPDLERRLTRALGAPVSIGSVRLALSPRIRLEGTDLRLEPRPGRVGLEVKRVTASFRGLALTPGRPLLRHILLDGATLSLRRREEGDAPGPPAARGSLPHPEELLSPLIGLETSLRRLLARPYAADTLEVRNSTIVFVDERVGNGDSAPATLTLVGVRGQLRHARLRGDAHVQLKGRLLDAGRERGSVAWEGRRDRNGAVRLTMAATQLELAALAPYVNALSDAKLDGSISGVIAFESSVPGSGELEVDLVGIDMKTEVAPPTTAPFAVMTAPRLAVQATFDISPERVRLSGGRLVGRTVELKLDADVAQTNRDRAQLGPPTTREPV